MKNLLLYLIFSIIVLNVNSAPFKFLQHNIEQPDGTIIECFLSGDEFSNWIHDKDGYSIIKGSDRYYYYAIKEGEKIVASKFRVNSINPKSVELKKWTIISKDEYKKRKASFEIPLKKLNTKAPHTGTLNNLVIYIRFNGESEITTTRQVYDDKLNPLTGNTLKSFYNEVSYNQLIISSTHYPDCATPVTTNASYEDSHDRTYFQPFDVSTNPNGYDGDTEHRVREHQLLVDAVTWVNTNFPVSVGLNIDADNDGYVDNICFMIQGNADGWSELLWAHRWSLYSQDVYINGKLVYDYTFQPENQVGVRTLCHEMFHALGAPDLYHYDDITNMEPVGYWDVMESGNGHMGAYMKYKYADQNWITDIPEITTAGTYTLNPLTSSTNNCFKIASPNSTSEFFVVEYRSQSGDFESNLPGEGLLVYRINSNFNGNANYDGTSIFDEVYIYRPNGTTTTNGNPNNAHYSADVSRTEINDGTNPSCFLTNGTDGLISIKNITTPDSTISFDVTFPISNPENLTAASASLNQIDLNWNLNSNNNDVILAYTLDGIFGSPEEGVSYSTGNNLVGGGEIIYNGGNNEFSHLSLLPGQNYFYKIWSVNALNEYSAGLTANTFTPCEEKLLPFSEDFSIGIMPACWQNKDNEGNGQVWEFNNPGGIIFTSTSSGNGFAVLDSDYYGDNNSQDAELMSPTLDLSIYSSVNLKFEHYFRQYEFSIATLSYSTNGGNTWDTLQTWEINEGTQLSASVYDNDISTQVAGKSNVKLKWHYTGAYDYYWAIDDIEITGVSSGIPVTLVKDATNIALTQATLNGIVNANSNNVTNIQFEYGTTSGSLTSTTSATPAVATGSLNTKVEADLSGLSLGTEYFYRVAFNVDASEYVSEENSFVTDTLPTIYILSLESISTSENPIPLTFTFSKDVSGFEISDISVTNGSAEDFDTISASIYTANITPVSFGEITVIIPANAVQDINSNGNIESNTWTISYLDPTGINDLKNEGIKLYPIPTNDIINIELNKPYKKCEIKLLNYSGKVIYSTTLNGNKNRIIDLSNEIKGIYIIQFNIDNKKLSAQLIIE